MRLVLFSLALIIFSVLACSSPESQDTSESDQWDFSENSESVDVGFVQDTGSDTIEDVEDVEDVEDDDVSPVECPPFEDGYHYVSDDPEECEAIFVTCIEGEEYFEDPNCGCGCLVLDSPIDECDAQDAVGEGQCRASFGYAFNGRTCTNISGCECVGEDCDDLYPSRDGCAEAFGECLDDACEPMDAMSNDETCPAFYGYAYQGEERGCVEIHGCDCVGEHCDLLYDDRDICAADHLQCQSPSPLPDGPTCNAWDLDIQGPCDAELGFYYDGNQCVSASGCACVGNDCYRLSWDLEDCQKQIRDCDGTCGDPDGVICDIYMGFDPSDCPDASAYTVINCEPVCVDPDSCQPVE